MTSAARIAYDKLTRESLTRAYVPAAEAGAVSALGELARLGLITTVVLSGTLCVIRVCASHSHPWG